VKMHILSGGRLRMRKSIYLPDADRSETIELPVSSILLRDARGNVLFDTGCHPSVVEDAPARWGGLAKLVVPIMGPDDNVIAGLAALGLEPGDIDVVVCSHLHPDHCGCNAFFTRATVMVHARELEAARQANAPAWGYVAADWDNPIPIEPITGERDLYGNRARGTAGAEKNQYLSCRIGNRPQSREKSLTVGVLADVALAAADSAIDGANDGGGAAETVEILDHGDLVRHGTVEPDPAHRTRAAHSIAQRLRGYFTIEIARVDEMVRIRGLDHRHGWIPARRRGE